MANGNSGANRPVATSALAVAIFAIVMQIALTIVAFTYVRTLDRQAAAHEADIEYRESRTQLSSLLQKIVTDRSYAEGMGVLAQLVEWMRQQLEDSNPESSGYGWEQEQASMDFARSRGYLLFMEHNELLIRQAIRLLTQCRAEDVTAADYLVIARGLLSTGHVEESIAYADNGLELCGTSDVSNSVHLQLVIHKANAYYSVNQASEGAKLLSNAFELADREFHLDVEKNGIRAVIHVMWANNERMAKWRPSGFDNDTLQTIRHHLDEAVRLADGLPSREDEIGDFVYELAHAVETRLEKEPTLYEEEVAKVEDEIARTEEQEKRFQIRRTLYAERNMTPPLMKAWSSSSAAPYPAPAPLGGLLAPSPSAEPKTDSPAPPLDESPKPPRATPAPMPPEEEAPTSSPKSVLDLPARHEKAPSPPVTDSR